MRGLTTVLTLAIGLQLLGCANIHAVRPDVGKQIEQWVQEDEYGKALETIDAVKPKHPDYALLQRQRPQIERAARDYEMAVLREGRRLMQAEQWQPALDIYDEGLKKMPQSNGIREAHEAFLDERAAYLDQLNTKLLISKGQQLIRDRPVHEEIAKVTPKSYFARRNLERQQEETVRTAAELYVCGAQALDAGDTYLAHRCLKLAHALAPTKESETLLAKAKRLQSSAEGKKQRAKKRKLDRNRARKTDELLTAYKKAYAAQDLLLARDLLEDAAALQPDHAEIQRLGPQLDAAIYKEVKAGIEEGRKQYTMGHIQEALAIWTPLLRLDPDNKQLNEHIDRAQRVLDNLREIEQRQPTVKFSDS